jgi:3D (Asp-Asp-Asp) domain-containing protein
MDNQSLITNMITNIHSVKAKHIIIALLIILVWEFSFPQPVVAYEININESKDLSQYFKEQWSLRLPETLKNPLQLPEIPNEPQPDAKKSMSIAVTAYSSTPDQTSGDPFITASGTRVRDGIIAANFLPIGTKVRFPEKFGNKIFVVEDRMSQRYWYHADIWMETREQAKEWGVKHITVEIL